MQVLPEKPQTELILLSKEVESRAEWNIWGSQSGILNLEP